MEFHITLKWEVVGIYNDSKGLQLWPWDDLSNNYLLPFVELILPKLLGIVANMATIIFPSTMLKFF